MFDADKLCSNLISAGVSHVLRNERLKKYSNWRIGGAADVLVEPITEHQIATVIKATRHANAPLIVIGDGTNLLFDDAGVRGVVMKIGRRLGRFCIEGTTIRAQAGVWMPRLARVVGCAGLGGLEHAVGIPGTLGGLIWMNGGSMRYAIGDNIKSVSAIDSRGQLHVIRKERCEFGRRKSVFQSSTAVIVGAELECMWGSPTAIRSEMLRILRHRRSKFPLKMPNCGSVFISGGTLYERFGPPGLVIERLGLKGMRYGDAQVSPVHGNVFVNLGRARSVDMLRLIGSVRSVVHNCTGILMDCEVRYVAPSGLTVPAHLAVQA